MALYVLFVNENTFFVSLYCLAFIKPTNLAQDALHDEHNQNKLDWL